MTVTAPEPTVRTDPDPPANPPLILPAPLNSRLTLRNADGHRLVERIAVAVQIQGSTISVLDGLGGWRTLGEDARGNTWRIESTEDAADSGCWS